MASAIAILICREKEEESGGVVGCMPFNSIQFEKACYVGRSPPEGARVTHGDIHHCGASPPKEVSGKKTAGLRKPPVFLLSRKSASVIGSLR